MLQAGLIHVSHTYIITYITHISHITHITAYISSLTGPMDLCWLHLLSPVLVFSCLGWCGHVSNNKDRRYRALHSKCYDCLLARTLRPDDRKLFVLSAEVFPIVVLGNSQGDWEQMQWVGSVHNLTYILICKW